MKVVFTGKMRRTRDRETKKYEDVGITVQSGITKATEVLVCGYDVGNGKMTKAAKYGIKIMDEDDFFAWLYDTYPEFDL